MSKATIVYANRVRSTSSDITWSVSNPAVASVDANGVVTGLSAGKATLIVNYNPTGLVGTVGLAVTTDTLEKIEVTSSSATTIPIEHHGDPRSETGRHRHRRSCACEPCDARRRCLVGLPSNTAIASVDADGAVTGVAVGNVTITATDPISGLGGSLALKVENVAVSSIDVTPAKVALPAGGVTQAYVATAIYETR